MNILYYTNLNGKKTAGLTYSIPQQIQAQSEFDNVLWFNTNCIDEWNVIPNYYTVAKTGTLWIMNFPVPFNKPDLVIFESLNLPKDWLNAYYLRHNKIPYIIIPRGALTNGAQNKRKVKKAIANILIQNQYIKKALAIQYLTKNEYEQSKRINSNAIIIPNGAQMHENTKRWTSSEQIKAVFVGRYDVYHKGIDLLFEACAKVGEKLRKNSFVLNMYGAGDKAELNELVKRFNLADIVKINDPVYSKEKETALLSSDVFILTSRFEGHPMGVIEALSYGLPCLLTKGTNMTDELEIYQAGWICDNSLDSIIAGLTKMIDCKDKLSSASEKALALSNNYRWDNLAKLSHDEYSRLLNET